MDVFCNEMSKGTARIADEIHGASTRLTTQAETREQASEEDKPEKKCQNESLSRIEQLYLHQMGKAKAGEETLRLLTQGRNAWRGREYIHEGF